MFVCVGKEMMQLSSALFYDYMYIHVYNMYVYSYYMYVQCIFIHHSCLTLYKYTACVASFVLLLLLHKAVSSGNQCTMCNLATMICMLAYTCVHTCISKVIVQYLYI